MIIGLTGSLAAGKGVVSEFLKEKGFVYLSLSDELREIAREKKVELTREKLQNLGNYMRETYGGGYLAEKAFQKIKNQEYKKAIVDGIRNPAEIEVLRKIKDFFLVSVDAPQEIRFQRIVSRNRESDPKTSEDFLKVDNRDKGIGEPETGQGVGKCMEKADFVLINSGNLTEAEEKVKNLYEEIEKKIPRPTWDEYFLNLAKYVSTRSRDPSTQIGAVIVRPDKSICSTGFNGFPQKMPDHEELYANREEKYSRIIHGEINALTFSRDQSHQGYTLYTWPMLSCDRCFVQMVQAGITRFVAPKATEEKLTRWRDAFERVKQYAKECHVEIVEI